MNIIVLRLIFAIYLRHYPNRGSGFSFKYCQNGKSYNRQFQEPMTDLLAIIQNGNGNIKLEVTGEDLLLFSNQLISRAKHELSTAIAEAKKEKYLTKEEVKKMCDVCDTTLWHWSKKNYLKPVKVGNKVRYRQSDIQKILGGHNPLI